MHDVMIAYCYSRTVEGLFADSLCRLLLSDVGSRISEVVSFSGSIIHTGRNMLMRQFLKSDSEWLWMIDTDHTFSPSTLSRLLQWADPVHVPVLGALCVGGGRSGFYHSTMIQLRDENGGLAPMAMSEWPRDVLVQVDATGAACLLVHRTAAQAVADAYATKAPWEWFGVGVANGVEFGEDVFFCERLRSVGVPIYVHTGIEAPHVKQDILTSETLKRTTSPERWLWAAQGAPVDQPMKSRAERRRDARGSK